MPLAPYDLSISAARADALFASPLQRSDEPSARQASPSGGSQTEPAHIPAPGRLLVIVSGCAGAGSTSLATGP